MNCHHKEGRHGFVLHKNLASLCQVEPLVGGLTDKLIVISFVFLLLLPLCYTLLYSLQNFLKLQDPAVTDVAIGALNGLKMGDKTLSVRRASARWVAQLISLSNHLYEAWASSCQRCTKLYDILQYPEYALIGKTHQGEACALNCVWRLKSPCHLRHWRLKSPLSFETFRVGIMLQNFNASLLCHCSSSHWLLIAVDNQSQIKQMFWHRHNITQQFR